MRTTPFDSTVTRCSRDALTVDPSDGAISGRSPAYVPTTSSRVRSTSIVALTVSSNRSTSQPAADGWSGGPSIRRVGRADQPVVGPRDEEDDPAGDPDRQPGLVRDPFAAARRGGRRGWAGCSATDHGTGGRAGPPRRRSRRRSPGSGCRRAAPVIRSSASTASITPNVPSVRSPVARTRVTATPPAACAVRATASV